MVKGYNAYMKVGGHSRREKGGSKAAGKLSWSKVVLHITAKHLKNPLWETHGSVFVSRDHYVLGGIHMTNLAYLPNALLKGSQVSLLTIIEDKNMN